MKILLLLLFLSTILLIGCSSDVPRKEQTATVEYEIETMTPDSSMEKKLKWITETVCAATYNTRNDGSPSNTISMVEDVADRNFKYAVEGLLYTYYKPEHDIPDTYFVPWNQFTPEQANLFNTLKPIAKPKK
jgi:hypothetical protein